MLIIHVKAVDIYILNSSQYTTLQFIVNCRLCVIYAREGNDSNV